MAGIPLRPPFARIRRSCRAWHALAAAGLLIPLVALPDAANAATPSSATTGPPATTANTTNTPDTTSPSSTSPPSSTSTAPVVANPSPPTTAAGQPLAETPPLGSSTPSTVTLTPPSVQSPLVGAYYSDWYPQNAAQGTLRADLVPSQGTIPGDQDNASPATAEKAIQQASQAGINFFAMNYWPTKPAQNANLDAFLKAPNIADIKFCIFYETWDVAVTSPGSSTPTMNFDAAQESTPITPAMEQSFDNDMVTFAQKYFNNPSYLKFNGRPVLVLYLTRTLTGDVSGLINGARQTLEALGYNPYIIGDEVFWRVTAENPPATGSSLTQTPQTARIWDFDAITSYSLYSSGSNDPLSPDQDFSTYPGETNIVKDETSLYQEYKNATGNEVPVIPDATPGENTRGVRLAVNEHAEPRQWLPGEGPGTTLQHFLDQIAGPEVDPRVPMLFITTWNEWNEDTGVEPVGGTPTTKDDSPTGQEYTQGYTYGGEGDADLVVIRNYVGVAWGQVINAAGKPVAHTLVQAFRNGVPVSTAETNTGGWYVLRRTTQTTGTLTVGAGSHRAKPIKVSSTVARRSNVRI